MSRDLSSQNKKVPDWPQTLQTLRSLSGSWRLAIIVEISRYGNRFSSIEKTLEISPSRLSENLRALESEGIVKHVAPGERHHPLLPEYRLTEKGLLLLEVSESLERTFGQALRASLLRSWSLAILMAIHQGDESFSGIKASLSGVTSKTLSQRLKELEELAAVERKIETLRPLTLRYCLTPKWHELTGTAIREIYSETTRRAH